MFRFEGLYRPIISYLRKGSGIDSPGQIKDLLFKDEMLADEYLAYSVSLYYEYAVVKHEFIEPEQIKELGSRHIVFFWDSIKK